ncbi:hypothetical protein PR048_005241 [Dryococelus australis]|uniref:Uncharacterized protein n=1 Tax=Dryococelus australis TaxID=614101 RepID=A0ABQ9I8S1_9NEOP|nr:hypothetical protein PR048_005241 [Dryococelus australis]
MAMGYKSQIDCLKKLCCVLSNGISMLNIPTPKAVLGRVALLPYVFVADDDFTLTNNIIGNIQVMMEKVQRGECSTIDYQVPVQLLKSYASLYTFLWRNSQAAALYTPPETLHTEDTDNGGVIAGSWRNNFATALSDIPQFPRRAPKGFEDVREESSEYFMAAQGRVS